MSVKPFYRAGFAQFGTQMLNMLYAVVHQQFDSHLLYAEFQWLHKMNPTCANYQEPKSWSWLINTLEIL